MGERVQFLLWYRATLSLLCKLSLFGQSKFSFYLVFFPSFFPSNFLLEILNFLSFWNKMESDVVFKAMFQFCKLGTAPKEAPKESRYFLWEYDQWSYSHTMIIIVHTWPIYISKSGHCTLYIVHCTIYNSYNHISIFLLSCVRIFSKFVSSTFNTAHRW